jgi:DNA-binding GntR family transcriptional regulator
MNSFDKVHRGIMKAIYESRLSPGQRLVAPALAQEFQASRNTVREVLGQLAAAGVITMVRNQSPCVRILSRNEMNELLDVVSALLSLAAESAARNLGMPEARQELSEGV